MGETQLIYHQMRSILMNYGFTNFSFHTSCLFYMETAESTNKKKARLMAAETKEQFFNPELHKSISFFSILFVFRIQVSASCWSIL